MSLFVYRRNCVAFVSIDQENIRNDLVYEITGTVRNHVPLLYTFYRQLTEMR